MNDHEENAGELRALQADPPQAAQAEHVDAAFGDVVFDRLGFLELMVNEFLAV